MIAKPPVNEGELMFERFDAVKPALRIEQVDYEKGLYTVEETDWNKGSLLKPGRKTVWKKMSDRKPMVKRVDGKYEDMEW